MPSKSEIEFCERWLDLRGADGFVVWARGDPLLGDPGGNSPPWYGWDLDVELGEDQQLCVLTASGADLVACYESALALELEIKPDPEPGMRPPWDPAPVRKTETRVVCDCDDGFIGIPISYGTKGGCSVEGHERGGVIEVWPARCPKCNVDRGRPGENLVLEPMAAGKIEDGRRPLGASERQRQSRQIKNLSKEQLEAVEIEREINNRRRREARSQSFLHRFGSRGDSGASPPTPLGPRGGSPRILDGNRAALVAGTGAPIGWRQLDHDLAKAVLGKTVELRHGIDPAARTMKALEIVTETPSGEKIPPHLLLIALDHERRPLAEVGKAVPLDGCHEVRLTDGWRALTNAEGQRLAGKPFEARRGIDDPPHHHVAMSAQQQGWPCLRLVGGGLMLFDGTWWVRDAVAP